MPTQRAGSLVLHMITKETRVKKRMRRGKKPVLTSPWKIGIFVSLLLVFMSLGVSFYIVNTYHVSMQWLPVGGNIWTLDSLLFFKEIYPLAAGIIIVSIIGYLVIANSVRQYKYYLDSGQDYRRMISLAESIDDLTNPAQIARLASYPELQSVLRNYGDQMREISQTLDQRGQGAAMDGDLEGEIERALRGEPAGDSVFGAEHASICGAIREYVASNGARVAELEKGRESERSALGQAALAYGRAMEAIAGAGEDLLAITDAAAALAKLAGAMRGGASPSARPAPDSRDTAFKAVVADMESSVRKLQECGGSLQEFSEENNGIAIHLALMATRGNVDQHDLAAFAERVRVTAERFHALSATVSSVAQGLLGPCYTLREKAGASASAASVDPAVPQALERIARTIEGRGGALQKQICGLGSELCDAREALQKTRSFAGAPPSRGDVASPRVDETPRGAASAKPRTDAENGASVAESSELVIDRGRTWMGIDGESDAEGIAPGGEETPQREKRACSSPEASEAASVAEAAESAAGDVAKRSDYSDMSSLRELESAAPQEDELLADRDGGSQGEGWMEMPGHRWLKIDVAKASAEDESKDVEVKVEEPSRDREPDAGSALEREEAVLETEAASKTVRETASDRDAGKIYDLFELGAVEYVEEAQARR